LFREFVGVLSQRLFLAQRRSPHNSCQGTPLWFIIGSRHGRHLRADVAFTKVGRSIRLSERLTFHPDDARAYIQKTDHKTTHTARVDAQNMGIAAIEWRIRVVVLE
jgi:hypothetical protein